MKNEFSTNQMPGLSENNLAEVFGFNQNDLKDDSIKAAINQAQAAIIQGVWLKILESLPKEKIEELTPILEELEKKQENEIVSASKKLIEFLEKELPDYQSLIKAEINNYKSRFLKALEK